MDGTIKNILSNYIPHKTINCDDKDPPCIKGALSGLEQFLTIKSPSKMMKNVFYFILKVLFVLKIFILNLNFLVM